MPFEAELAVRLLDVLVRRRDAISEAEDEVWVQRGFLVGQDGRHRGRCAALRVSERARARTVGVGDSGRCEDADAGANK